MAGPRPALHPTGLPGRADNLPGWLCSEWGWRGANNNSSDNSNHLCVPSFLLSYSLLSLRSPGILTTTLEGGRASLLTPTGPRGHWLTEKGDLLR